MVLRLFSSICGNFPYYFSFAPVHHLGEMFFKVWSLGHLYQNHWRCTFKMHIPRLHHSSNEKVIPGPQNSVIIACFPGGFHAYEHVSFLVPLQLSKPISTTINQSNISNCPQGVLAAMQREGELNAQVRKCLKKQV